MTPAVPMSRETAALGTTGMNASEEDTESDCPPTEEQVAALRVQIQAYEFIKRGAPIPEHLQAALLPRNNAIANLETPRQYHDVPIRRVNAAVKITGTAVQQHASATPEAPETTDSSPGPGPRELRSRSDPDVSLLPCNNAIAKRLDLDR